ncbi:MAG: RecX family transcriptional regulator [Acidobacteriota bacterium]
MGYKKSPSKRAAPVRLDEAKLLDYALNSLSRRAHSEKELRTRLARRADSQGAVDGVVTKLREYGYVDDARFAEGYAAARLETRGHGKMRVLRDLRARSVDSAHAQKAVEMVFSETNEVELIEQYLARKYRGKVMHEFLADPKNLAAAYRRLRVAGFASGPSIKVLKRHSERADELEDSEESVEASE